MRWREAKELSGMVLILGMLVGTGWGLSSLAAQPEDVVEVREAPGAPVVEESAAVGRYEAAGPAVSDASIDPVGRPSGG